jgi:hypothetical protein
VIFLKKQVLIIFLFLFGIYYYKKQIMKKLFTISQEEKQRILEMHTSATNQNYIKESYHKNSRLINEQESTNDLSQVNASLKSLNDTLLSIPNKNKDKVDLPAVKYLSERFYITLSDLSATGSIHYINPTGGISSTNASLTLMKTDSGEFGWETTQGSTSTIICGCRGTKNTPVATFMEDMKRAYEYGINKKDLDQAWVKFDEVQTMITNLCTLLKETSGEFPQGKKAMLHQDNSTGLYRMDFYELGE